MRTTCFIFFIAEWAKNRYNSYNGEKAGGTTGKEKGGGRSAGKWTKAKKQKTDKEEKPPLLDSVDRGGSAYCRRHSGAAGNRYGAGSLRRPVQGFSCGDPRHGRAVSAEGGNRRFAASASPVSPYRPAVFPAGRFSADAGISSAGILSGLFYRASFREKAIG